MVQLFNTNVSEYQLYMQRRQTRKSQSDQIKSACREINNLKKELREIKNLILELVKNNAIRKLTLTDSLETLRTEFNALACSRLLVI